MAQSKVQVEKSYADTTALQTWLGNLGTDVVNDRITNFNISVNATDKVIGGEVTLSAATAINDLSIDVEDA